MYRQSGIYFPNNALVSWAMPYNQTMYGNVVGTCETGILVLPRTKTIPVSIPAEALKILHPEAYAADFEALKEFCGEFEKI